jgi:cobalt-zinc-cadmium efflux system outer membrane protein
MKQIHYLTLILFFLTGFSMPLFGNEMPSVPEIEERLHNKINISDLLNYAYMKNPSIQSEKESWNAVIENYKIKTSYPDPQFMMTYFPSPVETKLGPQDWNFTFSQPIPFPGMLAQKGKVLESDTRISKLKVDKTVKKITTAIVISFQELVYIQKAIGFAKANYDLSLELLKIGENAYADNRSSFYDVSKAQAQTAQIQYDILLLEELLHTEKTKINTLINRDPGAPLGIAGELAIRELAYSIDEIWALFLDYQEDILIAEEKINKSRELVSLSKLEAMPSFKLGLFYAGIGDPDTANPPLDAGKDAIGIQFGLNIPIWFGKNKSKTLKALAGKRKAQADKDKVANQAKAGISRLWFKLQNSKRLITLYEKNLIPQSLKSIQTTETWFRQGEGSFSDFLEVQATTYNFQLSLERAKTDYIQTLARLENLAGIALDKKTIAQKGENQS